MSDKLAGKASSYKKLMHEAKIKLKTETEMQRKIMLDIKQKHTEIMRLEDK